MIIQPIPRLTGRTLLFARLIWLAFVALAVGTYLAAVFIYANELQHLCLASVEECKQPGRLLMTPADVAHLQGEGVSLSLFATLETAKLLFFSSIWFIIGGLIFLRKSNEWMALLTAFFLVTFGTGFDGVFGALTSAYPAWWLAVKTAGYLSGLSSFFFLALFPNGRFVPRWTRWVIILYGLVAIPEFFFPAAWLNSRQLNDWLQSANLVIYGLLVLAQIYRYWRISTLSERQQTLWPVLGIIAGTGIIGGLLIPLWLLNLAFAFQASLASLFDEVVYQIAVALIPLSIGVAILRYRLFDIDLIIRRTLQYSVLSALLALVYFGGVVVLQRIFTSLTGQGQNQLVTVLSTLAIAALFNPVRRRVQDGIDRRFYRKKYDAAKTLAAFAATVRDETDLDKLAASLIAVVQETMQPTHVSLWLKPTEDHRRRTEPSKGRSQ